MIYDRVAPLVPHFKVAAEKYALPDWRLLAALCDRESLCGRALAPDLTGDNGHGKGLMQIDDRSNQDWLAEHDYRDATQNITRGAELFARKLAFLDGNVYGAVAAYNCGEWKVRQILKRGLPVGALISALDAVCTKGRDPKTGELIPNYVTDVLARWEALKAVTA